MKSASNSLVLLLTLASVLLIFPVPTGAKNDADTSYVSVNVLSITGYVGFSVQLEIPGDTSLGPQHMLFDTGSSSLVFCKNEIRNLLNNTTPYEYPGDSNVLYLGKQNDQCIGNAFLMANSYGTSSESYTWGYVYEGDLLVTNHGDNDYSNARKMPNIAFAIAEDHGTASVCAIGFDGIFGAGFFRSGNKARVPISSDVSSSDVLCFEGSCSSDTFDPVDDWCNCEGTDSTVFYLYPAIEKALRTAGSAIFGIYLPTSPEDFDSLLESEFTYNAGMVFVGDDALQTKYYKNYPVHATVTSDNDGQHRYWSLPMKSIQVFCDSTSDSDLSYSLYPLQDFCDTYQCFLDTGVPKNVFPQTIVDQINSCTDNNGSVHIQMDGGNLTMDTANLKSIKAVGSSDDYAGYLILGFPTWLWYYTVFDFGSEVEGSAEITFVYTP